ncbi:uncharacterized protein [Narcine bancroftii]|uniref:uncharacterized protein n=1 Tax=Narcine bancroftii TaxID=1343680 RepID=UPI003831A64B
MTMPSISHKGVSQPRDSRLHSELEHSSFKTPMQTTEKGKEQLSLSKFAEQLYCHSENCCETPYIQAHNDRSALKSTMSSGEGDILLEMSTSNNLSDGFALSVKGCSKKSPSGGWRPSKMAQELPAPVNSVRVSDTVGQTGLVINWEKPSMDETGCSNGTFVQGYRIFIDGEFHMSVTGSICTKVELEGLDLSVPFQVSVQTVGDNGLVSRKVNAQFLNCWPHKMLSAQPHPTLSSQTSKRCKLPEETRFTFLPTESTRRMFIALHDYNPLQDSPNIHPSYELAFKEGDIIWMHGKQRRDGFCEAEVNGRHGLVPVCFLEDTSSGIPKSLKQKAPWSVSLSPGYNRMPKVSSSSELIHRKSSNR